MLAVVKKHHIKIHAEGDIDPLVLKALQKAYAKDLHISLEPEEGSVDYFSSDYSQQVQKSMGVGEFVHIYRTNAGLSQKALGEKLGVSNRFVCDIEKNRRAISKEMAKKMAKLFGTSLSRFIA
jgi:DNA-binding XRE family transcriptional regulator